MIKFYSPSIPLVKVRKKRFEQNQNLVPKTFNYTSVSSKPFLLNEKTLEEVFFDIILLSFFFAFNVTFLSTRKLY